MCFNSSVVCLSHHCSPPLVTDSEEAARDNSVGAGDVRVTNNIGEFMGIRPFRLLFVFLSLSLSLSLSIYIYIYIYIETFIIIY